MLAYIWCGSVFFLTTLVLGTKGHANISDGVVADVIRNISRVNTILQELITNYEMLQKIYKSQENFDVTIESPMFRDHVLKKNKKSKFFPATTLSFSDIDDGENDKKSKNTKKVTEKHYKASIDPIETSIASTDGSSRNDSSSSKSDSSSSENTEESLSNKSSANELTIQFLKSKKRLAKKENNKMITPEEHQALKKKVRFQVQHNNVKDKDRKVDTQPLMREHADLHNIKSKKKQQHIVSNITSLKVQNNNLHKTQQKAQSEAIVKHPPLSELYHSNGLSNLSHGNVTHRTKHNVEPMSHNEKNTNSEESLTTQSEDDMALTKELFKTNILRKAYGDACLKLVVSKCYKACKLVLKGVCRSEKCAAEFKTAYDRESRTGCIQSFVPTNHTKDAKKRKKAKETKACKNTIKNVCLTTSCKSDFKSDFTKCYQKKCDSVFAEIVLRQRQSNENDNDDFSAVCKPVYKAKTNELEGEHKTHANVTENPLHMLRAKYEKECVKTSREKCRDACKFAYTKACEKRDCKSKTVKKFEKGCKRYCKIAYFLEKSKNKSSDSDSDGSSDSSSSSDDD